MRSTRDDRSSKTSNPECVESILRRRGTYAPGGIQIQHLTPTTTPTPTPTPTPNPTPTPTPTPTTTTRAKGV